MTYEIKITGSGTLTQIEHSLRDLARYLSEIPDNTEDMPAFEDPVLYAELHD